MTTGFHSLRGLLKERAMIEDLSTVARVWQPSVFTARVWKRLRTEELDLLAEPRVRKLMKTLNEDFPAVRARKMAMKSAAVGESGRARDFFLEAARRFGVKEKSAALRNGCLLDE